MASRISSRSFVGREEELAILGRLVAAIAAGSAGTLLIAGEAGIGKTRLVAELRRITGDAQAYLGSGGSVSLGEGSLPFGPVSGALHDLLAGFDEVTLQAILGQRAGELVRILPGLADRLPDLQSSPTDEFFRARLFDGVLASLEMLASRAPVVLVFEDLHWADPASLDLIAFLIRAPRRRRVLIVGTYRSDELHRRHPLLPWLAEIGRHAGIERLELERLGPREIEAQISGILGSAPPPSLVAAIGRRSAGNPFFVEELLAADGPGGVGRLPSSLREVLLGRLAILGDRARSVVDVASVAGGPIGPALMAEVSGMPPGALADAIREALEKHVLEVVDGGSGDLDYRHALVREAVYEELLPAEGIRLHRAFGAALAARGEPETALRAGWWAQRAHHAVASQDQAGALVASVAAGHAAYDVSAFETALDHFERALRLLDVVPDGGALIDEDRVALTAIAAEAAGFAGHGARALALNRAALAALTPADPPARRARLLLDLPRTGLSDYQAALEATRAANALLADGPPTALRARAEASLARDLSAVEHWPEALEISRRAVATACAAGDPSAEALSRIRLARSLAALGAQREGEDEAERALALARAVRDRRIVGIVFSQAARVHEGAGDMRGSAMILDEASALADELGIRESDFEILRAWNHFQFGDWETTVAILADHERTTPELDQRFHTLSSLVNARRGRHDIAAAHLEHEAHPDPGTSALVRAEVAIWADRPAEAANHARAGLAAATIPYQFETWKGWLNRILARAEGDLAVRARRRKRAAEASAAAERSAATVPELERLNGGPVSYRDRHGGELRASLAHARAEAARAAGQQEPGLWADAVHEWQAVDRPFEVAYARWREGEAILAAGGSRSDARDRLSEADSIARRLGAEPIASAVEKLAARVRIQLAPAPASSPAPDATPPGRGARIIGASLTPREREVLALLCRGASNRQIAESLFITENTAGVHVSNILGKLDVGSRTEAVAVAHMAGLAQPQPAT